MFLRSNLQQGGLLDCGATYQATYAGIIDNGCIQGVVSHTWNGMVLLQAPVCTAEITRTAVARTGRRITGMAGPWLQVTQVCRALGLLKSPASFVSHELLFCLKTENLVIPEVLTASQVQCRLAIPDDLDLLTAWRTAFQVEAQGKEAHPNLEKATRSELERLIAGQRAWLLFAEESPVSVTTFNAELPDMVQIGGVYTPLAARNRGFARAVVAASLLDARRRGVNRAVLSTRQNNCAAQAAYRALGFQLVGDYGLVLWTNSILP